MIIYQIKNNINGKSYIGKSESTFQSRYGRNWHKAVSNTHLKRSLKKYGQNNFTVNILAETKSSKRLSQLERFYIRMLDTISPNGYNFTYGGEGSKQIPEVKKKISRTMKKIPLHHRGKYERQLTSRCKICNKEMLSYFNRGKLKATCSKVCHHKLSSINASIQMKSKRIRVEAVSIDGTSHLKFESLTEAEKHGFSMQKIMFCVEGKYSQHKGYIWRKI